MGFPWLTPLRLSVDLCICLLFSLSLFSNYFYFLLNYNLPLILHFLSDVPQGWNVTQLLTHPSRLSSGNLLQETLPWLKPSSSLFSHGSSANCSLLAYKFKSISLPPPLVTWPNFVHVFEYKIFFGGGAEYHRWVSQEIKKDGEDAKR